MVVPRISQPSTVPGTSRSIEGLETWFREFPGSTDHQFSRAGCRLLGAGAFQPKRLPSEPRRVFPWLSGGLDRGLKGPFDDAQLRSRPVQRMAPGGAVRQAGGSTPLWQRKQQALAEILALGVLLR